MRYGRLHEFIDSLSYIGCGLLGSSIGLSISNGFNIWMIVSSITGAGLIALKYVYKWREEQRRRQLSEELEAQPWHGEWKQQLDDDLFGEEEIISTKASHDPS